MGKHRQRRKFKQGNDFFLKYKNKGYSVDVAEGDSWFHFPINIPVRRNPKSHPKRDLLDFLSIYHNYAIWRVSKYGAELDEMIDVTLGKQVLWSIGKKNRNIYFFPEGVMMLSDRYCTVF